jgi:sodium pump decarboxylase gamma subunit
LNAVTYGFILLAVGMGVLFAAMALLILTMVILERLFRTRPLVPDRGEPEETEAVSQLTRGSEDEEIVAAITVALAQLRASEIYSSGLGTALEAGRGPWWTMARPQPRAGGRG